MIEKPPPILLVNHFPELLAALLKLLDSLSCEERERPTVAAGWHVHDIALHLLGDEINIFSSKRDDFRDVHVSLPIWEELVVWLNERNNLWVKATRRVTPRLVCDLLKVTGDQVNTYVSSLDPYMLSGPVSWAVPDPAPVWLDLAREFTERWHQQQHLRDTAVSQA